MLYFIYEILTLPPSIIANENHVFLRVYEDGVVEVNMTLTSDPFMPSINVYLIGNPTDLLIVDENNTLLTYELKDNNLTIYTLGAKKVIISYFTQSLTYKFEEIWTLNITSPYNLTVIMPPNAIILSLNDVPSSIISKDNVTIFSFREGAVTISYTIPLIRPTHTPPSTSDKKKAKELLFLNSLLLPIISAISVTMLLILLHRKLRSSKILTSLSEEERAIVEALRRRGGKAYQYEIARDVNLPKTTLWRHVRRLSQMGVIELEKHGKQNYLKLKKA